MYNCVSVCIVCIYIVYIYIALTSSYKLLHARSSSLAGKKQESRYNYGHVCLNQRYARKRSIEIPLQSLSLLEQGQTYRQRY